MKTLESILTAGVTPGMYRYASRALPESILTRVAEHGWQGCYVDGQEVKDKASFLNHFAESLLFPGYFGKNWDAFEDCLTDLMWLPAPGYVILYDHVRTFSTASPQDWGMACSILTQATQYWRAKQKPMYILLRQNERISMDIPWI